MIIIFKMDGTKSAYEHEKSWFLRFSSVYRRSGIYIFHFNPPPLPGERGLDLFIFIYGKKYDEREKKKRKKDEKINKGKN